MTDIPEDFHALAAYFSLIRHMRAAGKSAGLSIVTVRVLVDEQARPILFSQPEATRLMPRDNTRAVINDLLFKLTDKGQDI